MPSTCLTHLNQCNFAIHIKGENLSVLELVPLRTKHLPGGTQLRSALSPELRRHTGAQFQVANEGVACVPALETGNLVLYAADSLKRPGEGHLGNGDGDTGQPLSGSTGWESPIHKDMR